MNLSLWHRVDIRRQDALVRMLRGPARAMGRIGVAAGQRL